MEQHWESIPQTARHTIPLVSRQRGEHPLTAGIYRGHRQFPHIQKIYEDNINGKISDERFTTMSMAFEEEQRQIKSAIPNMEQYLETETDKSDRLQRFIDKVKCITQLTELMPEAVYEFIEKIVVSKPEYIDGKRHQNLKIYYNGVGIVREPSPEEMEELFQEHMQDRTANQKIKTT